MLNSSSELEESSEDLLESDGICAGSDSSSEPGSELSSSGSLSFYLFIGFFLLVPAREYRDVSYRLELFSFSETLNQSLIHGCDAVFRF